MDALTGNVLNKKKGMIQIKQFEKYHMTCIKINN